MRKKMDTKYAKCMRRIRSKTVEPVLGTLLNFMNMKRLNTRGIQQANKHIIMAVLAYNLKKYLKFHSPKANSMNAQMENIREKVFSFFSIVNNLIKLYLSTSFSKGKNCKFLTSMP